MRWFCLLSVFLLACDEDKLVLPPASHAGVDRDDDPDKRLTVELTKYGELRFRGKPITLHEFWKALVKEVQAYKEAEMRKKDYLKNGEWSSLYLLMRADRDATWQHVSWLLATCRRARIFVTQFAVKNKRNETAKILCPMNTRPPFESEDLIIPVRITRKGGKPHYRIRTGTAGDFRALKESLRKEVAEARKLADFKVVAHVYVDGNMLLKHVTEALDVIKQVGLKKINFMKLKTPALDIAKLPRLPLPKAPAK